jgi:hypothetical protein
MNDAAWRHANLIGDAFAREILLRDLGQRSPECTGRANHPPGIFRRRLDPHDQIAGRSRPAMERECIRFAAGVRPIDPGSSVDYDMRFRGV